MPSWDELLTMSQPIPCDPSRGHILHMAEWKVVDGGVVVMRYQAFCTCYWSQRFPSGEYATALKAFQQHTL